jgi:hypothetical protein
MLAGWINRHQQDVIMYLKEENRILREKLGTARILLNNSQRMIPQLFISLDFTRTTLALSPDGKQVIATHVLSHYVRPTMEGEKGVMNMNALSLLDARTLEWIDTVVLDDPNLGAANLWAVAFSGDGRKLLVTHAGTHELSVVDHPALLERIAARMQTLAWVRVSGTMCRPWSRSGARPPIFTAVMPLLFARQSATSISCRSAAAPRSSPNRSLTTC